jgi:hypothetical protein
VDDSTVSGTPLEGWVGGYSDYVGYIVRNLSNANLPSMILGGSGEVAGHLENGAPVPAALLLGVGRAMPVSGWRPVILAEESITGAHSHPSQINEPLTRVDLVVNVASITSDVAGVASLHISLGNGTSVRPSVTVEPASPPVTGRGFVLVGESPAMLRASDGALFASRAELIAYEIRLRAPSPLLTGEVPTATLRIGGPSEAASVRVSIPGDADFAGPIQRGWTLSPREYSATFGSSTSLDFKATFFEANPTLKGQIWVHHAVEQQVLTRYPGVVTLSEMHSLENLRGISKPINPDIHLSKIRVEWNNFYKEHRLQGTIPTSQQLLEQATKLDQIYGSQFTPPVGQ